MIKETGTSVIAASCADRTGFALGQKEYIASCSFGKDSIATLLLAVEHNEPLDEICYVEVMYDNERNISGEHPLHRDFIYNTAIPYFEKLNIPTKILHSDRDYMYCFHHRRCRGEYKGRKFGFPLVGMCSVERDCKVRIIQKNSESEDPDVEIIRYLGIAANEPSRLARLNGTTDISLMAKYGVTEQDAVDLCRHVGLYSPMYAYSKRNGCWFCPNAKWPEIELTWETHPEHLEELAEMENDPEIVSRYWNQYRGLKASDLVYQLRKEYTGEAGYPAH